MSQQEQTGQPAQAPIPPYAWEDVQRDAPGWHPALKPHVDRLLAQHLGAEEAPATPHEPQPSWEWLESTGQSIISHLSIDRRNRHGSMAELIADQVTRIPFDTLKDADGNYLPGAGAVLNAVSRRAHQMYDGSELLIKAFHDDPSMLRELAVYARDQGSDWDRVNAGYYLNTSMDFSSLRFVAPDDLELQKHLYSQLEPMRRDWAPDNSDTTQKMLKNYMPLESRGVTTAIAQEYDDTLPKHQSRHLPKDPSSAAAQIIKVHKKLQTVSEGTRTATKEKYWDLNDLLKIDDYLRALHVPKDRMEEVEKRRRFGGDS